MFEAVDKSDFVISEDGKIVQEKVRVSGFAQTMKWVIDSFDLGRDVQFFG